MIFAVGGDVAADRPTSWIAPGLKERMPVSCYVLKESGRALIVDTGLAIHWPGIQQALDALLRDSRHRSLIMTRREPDVVHNLPTIVARYAPITVYCGGPINPLDFFERVERESTASHLRCIAGSDVTWMQPEATLAVGALQVRMRPTMLRSLPKAHLYEATTRTLFSSDTWALAPQLSAGRIGVLRSEADAPSFGVVYRHILHRFDWLAGIDTRPMQDEIADLLDGPRIDRLCSSSGCVIEGQAIVRKTLKTTIDVLIALQRERPVDRLRNLDRVRLLTVLANTQTGTQYTR